MKININNLPIRIGARVITNVTVNNDSSAYQEICYLAKEYRQRYADIPLSEISGVQAARTFFRAIGIDPTKRRPSSEALLRRALKNKEFYQINNLVDFGNFYSLKFLLPICLYDYDSIIGEVFVKIGDEKDEYLAHNQRIMNFHDKFVVCDQIGAFGSPLTDSLRTAVTEQTRNVLVIVFAPQDFDYNKLETHLDEINQALRQ